MRFIRRGSKVSAHGIKIIKVETRTIACDVMVGHVMT